MFSYNLVHVWFCLLQDEIPVSELSYPAPRPGKLADKSGCTAVDFEILQVRYKASPYKHLMKFMSCMNGRDKN